MSNTKTKMRALASSEPKELIGLRRKIVESYEQSELFAAKARGACNAAVAEAILCGQYLTRAKKIVGHGHWLEWLRKSCKEVRVNTAGRYMRLANSSHVVDLNDAASLRQAYIAAGIIDDVKRQVVEEVNDGVFVSSEPPKLSRGRGVKLSADTATSTAVGGRPVERNHVAEAGGLACELVAVLNECPKRLHNEALKALRPVLLWAQEH